MKHWVSLFLATLGVTWVLWTGFNDPRWKGHIVVDPVVYWHRSNSFFDNGKSWKNLGQNEYQPGALWVFSGIGSIGSIGGNTQFDPFLNVLIAFNLLLLVAHVALARIKSSSYSPWIMLTFALFTGPILLARFEYFVSFLVLLAWTFWYRKYFALAGFLLGLAIATKIYPVLLIPFLMASILSVSHNVWKTLVSSLLACGTGIALVLVSLVLWGSSLKEMYMALNFHFDKPFGIEGLLGSLIPLIQWHLEIPLRMSPRNGIYGFESDLATPVTFLFQWSWVLAFLALFFLVWKCRQAKLWSDPMVLFLALGWYITLGKLMAPQYVWWALPLLAMSSYTKCPWINPKVKISAVILICLSLIASQIVYPLNYSQFLDGFAIGDYLNWIFWVNFVKNLMWLLAMIILTIPLILLAFSKKNSHF